MKRTRPIALLALWGFLAGTVPVSAAVRMGLSVDSRGVNSFTLAIGEYFRVPQAQITVARGYRISDEELPVVFFIAQRGHVSPERVLKARRSGKTWARVALHFGVGPEAFYVASTRVDGPYGRAYGLYGKTGRDRWNRIQLTDGDIVNFVNLRFLSERNRCRPETVVQWRGSGYGFAQIHENLSNPAREGRPGTRGSQDDRERDARADSRVSMAPPYPGNRKGRKH